MKKLIYEAVVFMTAATMLAALPVYAQMRDLASAAMMGKRDELVRLEELRHERINVRSVAPEDRRTFHERV